MKKTRTFVAKREKVKRDWLLVDASGVPLGRLASQVAMWLQGKHKPIYTPHVDTGDFVIVTNASKTVLTGNKAQDKKYYRHTGYLGHLKVIPYGKLLEEKPDFVVKEAVRRMMPKNRLARQMLKKLKVYAGEDHPHQAQRPRKVNMQSEALKDG